MQLFLYLSNFNATSYLTRMIKEVFLEMTIFLMIYMIGHFAFAETFYFISESSAEELRFVSSYQDAFAYSFLTALGGFSYDTWNVNGNPQLFLCWSVMLLNMIVNMIVMLNLLISLITNIFE